MSSHHHEHHITSSPCFPLSLLGRGQRSLDVHRTSLAEQGEGYIFTELTLTPTLSLRGRGGR